MMQLIRRFIWAWRIAKESLTFSPESDTEFGWTEEDAMHLKTVLKSPVGRRMSAKLTNMVMRTAIVATQKTEDRDFWCGYARGKAMAVADLERLATFVKQQPIPNIKKTTKTT